MPIKIRESALKKITAYGFLKPGTKSVIHILDGVQGYSRKFEVLEKIAIRELKSGKKFHNGFQELQHIGFIQVKKAANSQQVKIDKRLWERDPSEIILEHQLIQKRLNQNARWLNKKSLIREIRNSVESKTRNKPHYYAVKVHLKFILTTIEFSKNETGLIRLSKFDSTSNKAVTNNNKQSTLINIVPHKECNSLDKEKILDNEQIEIEDAYIDFDQDEDIFATINQETEQLDVPVFENDIEHCVFGNSSIADEPDKPEKNKAEPHEVTSKGRELNNNIPQDNPLNQIAFELKQNKHFAISESYCEIAIIFNELKIIIEYDPSRHELYVTSNYEINTNFLYESLRMFSKAEMIGQLAINTIKNIDYLILKHKTSVIKYSLQEIMDRVEKIIHEAMQLQKMTR